MHCYHQSLFTQHRLYPPASLHSVSSRVCTKISSYIYRRHVSWYLSTLGVFGVERVVLESPQLLAISQHWFTWSHAHERQWATNYSWKPESSIHPSSYIHNTGVSLHDCTAGAPLCTVLSVLVELTVDECVTCYASTSDIKRTAQSTVMQTSTVIWTLNTITLECVDCSAHCHPPVD